MTKLHDIWLMAQGVKDYGQEEWTRFESDFVALRAVVRACMEENRDPAVVGFGGRRWDCKLCGRHGHAKDCPVPAALKAMEDEE